MNENTTELREVNIYTDGACIGNPGPGGYGVVLLYGQHRKELSGGFRLSTNNRMEITAAIVGLQSLKSKCRVTIYSDSQLLVDSINQGWAKKWRKKGWKKGSNWVLNADLWQELLNLCDEYEVNVVWVKGHSNILENDRADQLSMRAAQSTSLAIDDAYENGETQIRPPSLF